MSDMPDEDRPPWANDPTPPWERFPEGTVERLAFEAYWFYDMLCRAPDNDPAFDLMRTAYHVRAVEVAKAYPEARVHWAEERAIRIVGPRGHPKEWTERQKTEITQQVLMLLSPFGEDGAMLLARMEEEMKARGDDPALLPPIPPPGDEEAAP